MNNGEGTVGRLLNDETIANNVEQITEDAGGFIRSITRLQTLIGLRSEYNIVANTLKTYVSVQLQSRPDKYFLIELVDDPRGFRTDTTTYTTTDDPSKPQTTVPNTTTITDRFRFTFQLAKRIFLLERAHGAHRALRHQGVDRRRRRRRRDPAGAGVAVAAHARRSISICSTSAPTSIRASRSWRRSSSTSTSGSSAASTTCSTAAAPAPACRPAATTSSARSSPSTTTTSARCSPSAARRCSDRRDDDGQDVARQSVPARSRRRRGVGVVSAGGESGPVAVPAGERAFSAREADLRRRHRRSERRRRRQLGVGSRRRGADERIGERLHEDGAALRAHRRLHDADRRGFRRAGAALERKHDLVGEGCFGPRGEEPGRLYLAAPRELDPGDGDGGGDDARARLPLHADPSGGADDGSEGGGQEEAAAKKPQTKKHGAKKKPAAQKKPAAAKKPAATKKPAAAKKPAATKNRPRKRIRRRKSAPRSAAAASARLLPYM